MLALQTRRELLSAARAAAAAMDRTAAPAPPRLGTCSRPLSVFTLESDKATLDIPAPVAGTIAAVRVAVGDNVSAGHVIADLRTGDAAG